MSIESEFVERVSVHFPKFASLITIDAPYFLEQVLPPATPAEIERIERQVGVPLPEGYKALLSCARGFWLRGGSIQLNTGHPQFHDFEPFEKLTPVQQEHITKRGGLWPPPSQGMLCFAEFFMMGDGDQVLFDVARGMTDSEYPIMYYDHEDSPPSVRMLARSFAEFMESFLEYPEFINEDD